MEYVEIFITLILSILLIVAVSGGILGNCMAITSFILSAIALFWAVGIIIIRTKLNIEMDGGIENQIRIKVVNKSRYSGATNLNIEACTIDSGQTYHLKIDKEDFLILPQGDSRVFKIKCTQDIESRLKKAGVVFRVRVHSTHSFTGFGKAIEQRFRYDKEKNKFVSDSSCKC